VGHETDFTICDFAADLRAATPSAAAELAVPNARAQLDDIINLRSVLDGIIKRKLLAVRETVCRGLRISDAAAAYFEMKKTKLKTTMDKLHILSPFNVLKRGYCITYDKAGEPVIKVSDVKKGDEIELALSDGRVIAQVKTVRKNEG